MCLGSLGRDLQCLLDVISGEEITQCGAGKIFRGQPEAIGLDAKFFSLSRGKLQGEPHVRTVARRILSNKA